MSVLPIVFENEEIFVVNKPKGVAVQGGEGVKHPLDEMLTQLVKSSTNEEKALELKPVDSDIAYYIAALYIDKDDIDNAKMYAEKSLSLNKTNKNAKELCCPSTNY